MAQRRHKKETEFIASLLSMYTVICSLILYFDMQNPHMGIETGVLQMNGKIHVKATTSMDEGSMYYGSSYMVSLVKGNNCDVKTKKNYVVF